MKVIVIGHPVFLMRGNIGIRVWDGLYSFSLPQMGFSYQRNHPIFLSFSRDPRGIFSITGLPGLKQRHREKCTRTTANQPVKIAEWYNHGPVTYFRPSISDARNIGNRIILKYPFPQHS